MLSSDPVKIILLCVLVACGHTGYSQSASNPDSIEYRRQLELFDEVVGIENTEIINGPKYVVPRASDSHPFYNSPIASPGSLAFNGQPYFNLTLLYDTYSDELVIQQLRETGNYELLIAHKGNVESFDILGHHFENLRGSAAKTLGLGDGYYDVLYESIDFLLIVKRKKITKVELGKIVYEGDDKYLFAAKGKKAASFHGMKDFYSLLGDSNQKSELSAFVKGGNLKIKKRDGDLVAAAKYCDTLLRKQK